MTTPQLGHLELANGIAVEGTIRTRDLIMDGNIAAQFLNKWTLNIGTRTRASLALPIAARLKRGIARGLSGAGGSLFGRWFET
jgi:hypothetical protein